MITIPIRGWRLRSPRTLFLLLWLVLMLVFFWQPLVKYWKRRRFDIWHEQPYIAQLDDSIKRSTRPVDPEKWCKLFPQSVWNSTQIIVKVGASEAFTKLATQLKTNTACVGDLLIFSDYAEEVAGYKVRDALAALAPEEWEGNADYDIYVSNRKARDRGETVQRSSEGWKLDKYKFLPMLDATYDLRPDKQWYVFIEADTYVFWENLFRWLGHMDWKQPLYMGSPIWRLAPPEPHFAHGGSGIVVSNSGLKQLVKPRGHTKPPGSTQFGHILQDKCCGDAVLADAFHARGIDIKGYWPMINGEKPATLRFGKDEQWCEPVITLHHINETDMRELYEWELRRASSEPVLFRDVWAWQRPHFPEYREDWKILPEMDWVEGVKTPEACKAECLIYHRVPWCYQWQLHNGTCGLSPWIRVGNYQPPDPDGTKWYSGTIMDKVDKHERTMGQCKDAHWVRPNPR